tara:strand:+ start:92 stop:310 length:219 start_codon:yes stop_codon:yes gene_type:complete
MEGKNNEYNDSFGSDDEQDPSQLSMAKTESNKIMAALTGSQVIDAFKKQVGEFEKLHADKSDQLHGGQEIQF